MNRVLVLMVAAVALAGCGTLGRINSYGGGLADANFRVEDRAYSASIHPSEDVILVRPATMSGISSGLLQGGTFGMAGRHGDAASFRRVVNAFIGPAGCAAGEVTALDASTGYWEATWRCDPGVDLRRLMEAQRSDLRDGKPIHR